HVVHPHNHPLHSPPSKNMAISFQSPSRRRFAGTMPMASSSREGLHVRRRARATQVATMAETFPSPPGSASARVDAAPAQLRLEVLRGSGRPIEFDVTDAFLIGSVPGCDLRLPGTGLPPVICLIAPSADGILLRKLAPTFPI